MNKKLPSGISSLRAFNSKANAQTINLGLGKPHQDMPDELRHIAATIIENKQLRQDYTENAGLAPVRSLLEQHYELRSGSTILTHGTQEALFSVLLATINPGDEVLVPNPGFLAYAPMVQMLQGKASLYPLKKSGADFSYDMNAILSRITKKTKLVLLNAPGNPTGSTVSAEFVRQLASALKKKKILLLSDEVYGELHYSEPYIPYARYQNNIVTVNAFSKSHALTGWRIGWLACEDPKLFQRFLVAHQYLSTCSSVPAQHLVGAILADPALFNGIRDRFCAEYLGKRDAFFRAMGKTQTALPQAGFFAFLPIPKNFSSSVRFSEKLLAEKNVLVIPGEFFGSAGKRFIRVSYSVPIEKLKDAAEKIRAYY